MNKIYTYYDGTFMKEKDPNDTRCRLLIRHYQRYITKSGNTITKFDMDVVEYSDEDAMVAAIRSQKMRELPPEADGDPLYVPPRLRSKTNRRVNKVTA